ncbi:MAG: DUF1015 domain-containing protein [Actinomycetota bacterium]
MTSPTDVPRPRGLVLAPFRALRFDESVAGQLADVTSPPYDVIDDEQLAGYEAASEHNVVRIILPRGPESGAESRYVGAARLLEQWRASGALKLDDEPAIYVYEMREGSHIQRGLLGAVALVQPDAGIILPHENTMAGPVSDRLLLTKATQANTEPIFLVYDGGGAASAAVSDVGAHPPIAVSRTADGIEHRLWAISDEDVLAAIAGDLLTRRATIADGHHRYANYLQHQAEEHAAGHGNGPWDFGLTFLVDATAFGPQVHAIHRVMPTLAANEAVRLASPVYTARPLDGSLDDALESLATAGKAGAAFVVSDGQSRWLLSDAPADFVAAHLPAQQSAAWRGLDVSAAHHVLIRAIWGLTDDETTVDYRHDAPAAEAAARAVGGTALLLNPTPVEAVIAVANSGERMPRKSTLFTPKPRTGFVIRTFDAG